MTEPHFDEFGRGPLLRGFQERHGDRPSLPGSGVAAMLFAVRHAVNRTSEFPEQFKMMLARAVAEVVEKVLPKLIEAEIDRRVDQRLEPVRKAFAELRAEVASMKAGAGRPASTTVQPRRPVLASGK